MTDNVNTNYKCFALSKFDFQRKRNDTGIRYISYISYKWYWFQIYFKLLLQLFIKKTTIKYIKIKMLITILKCIGSIFVLIKVLKRLKNISRGDIVYTLITMQKKFQRLFFVTTHWMYVWFSEKKTTWCLMNEKKNIYKKRDRQEVGDWFGFHYCYVLR